jgi:protein-S-isoprenylcysteine O-methyltransferase Ste14
MDPIDDLKKRKRSKHRILAVIGAAVVVALACFTVVAVLPSSEKPFFDSPLRSAITGLGLLGVAFPLCIAGSLLRKHAAGSPYFEEGFMAGVLSLFGYIVMIVGILCLGLAVYALVHRLVAPEPPRPSFAAAWLEHGLRYEPGQHSRV